MEKPALRGEADFLVDLPAVLTRHGVDVSVEELYRAVWHSIEVGETSMQLVDALRAAGYDDRFDVSIYSCKIGLAKPDPAYFERAVAMIGSAPEEVLFVDDRADNVDGARSAGLEGIHGDLAHGHPRPLDLMAEHGVRPGA
ncbi:hypothetical protein NPS01_14210 [Nocardioides psychrotolerans]|uniref:Putative hydrolase of the HAD superfamily n=1 Tax=Nocardioides psychrotolerans TaxID=1005945 RepID=A0A1I3H4C9_9ACTN|nr:HAD-IA family hydrolase [Nocardioides psychrotolerans]GEP37758.1 hypothetical protein NPS01_14210 [Nocardioides psychrotolerans]SFI30407.1 putative hydrolase of the HAD superfamily [Nocardioides psychrotolerans]